MNLVTRICGSLEMRLNQPRLSLWRSIYFCIRTMPFHQAVRLPVFIYGRIHLFGLNGKVIFENTCVKTGMVKIGVNVDSFALFDHSGFIQLASSNALLVFEGPCRISVNSKIRVTTGELRLGKYVTFGSGTRIVCNGEHISIGNYTRTAFDIAIINSSFHSVYNDNKKGFKKSTLPIEIGAMSWIANKVSISPGAKVKDYTIICLGSLVNQDYTQMEGDCPMLAGTPAKVVACGVKRVFSPKYEDEIIKWFRTHPQEIFYPVELFDDNFTEVSSEF